MKNRYQKKGFTFTPAVFIIILLMMATAVFLVYVMNSGRMEVKLENSAIAKYSAETGIFQIKSKLAKQTEILSDGKVVNKWYNIKTSEYDALPYVNAANKTLATPTCADYIFPSLQCDDVNRNEGNTQKVSNLILLRENPNDPNSKIVGKYRITIDNGQLDSGKTSTGSLVAGYDRYNNKIWSNSTDKNYFKLDGLTRFGIRVDGFAVRADGVEVKPAQSVYAVLDIPNSNITLNPNNWGPTSETKSPASYMLSTIGSTTSINGATSEDKLLNLLSNQIITGPIHTNEQFAFTWKGNFDLFEPATLKRSKKNESFTVLSKRGSPANTGDLLPITVYQAGFLDGTWRVTVFGTNFPSDINQLYYMVETKSGVLVSWSHPVETGVHPSTNQSYLKFDLPVVSPTDFPLRISVGSPDQSTSFTLATSTDFKNYTPAEPLKIEGIMQVSKVGTWGLSEKVYKQSDYLPALTDDYRFIGKFLSAPPNNYIAWDPLGDEPNFGDTYYVTYITNYNMPHRKIKVYSPLTFSNTSGSFASSKLFYIHSHKAPGTTIARWIGGHDHKGSIFGMSYVNLLTNDGVIDYIYKNWAQALIYDWTFYHRHEISSNLLNTIYNNSDNVFFFWAQEDFKPSALAEKYPPIVCPDEGKINVQRAYFNQVLRSITDKQLTVDNSGNYQNPNQIPEEPENGYYDASKHGGIIDFRATYFANDLKYTAGSSAGQPVLPVGSKITDTATIYVNDKQFFDYSSGPNTGYENPNNPNPDYMKIADSKLSADYKEYTYVQIPKNAPTMINGYKNPIEGGIILVREGVVRIGGMDWNNLGGNATVRGTGYVNTTPGVKGKNTIIDGRLTIISYSEVAPSPIIPAQRNKYLNEDFNNTTDNPGDIVITGNVIYKNKVYKTKEQVTDPNYQHEGFRQYYFGASPTSISQLDTVIPWVTGNLSDSKEGLPLDPMKKLDVDFGISDPNPLKFNSLALISSNDIKIPVMHYYQTITNSSDPRYGKEDDEFDVYQDPFVRPYMKDTLTIHGQLIAGHQLTQTKASIKPNLITPHTTIPSKNDQLVMYGSFYSREQPDLSYFDRSPADAFDTSIGRIYMFDKALSAVPLAGAPYFPIDSTYTTTYVPTVNLPRIVPGTFKNVSDGAN
ncbi:MAG: hypothetical protein U0457_19310 [Candidatus Sericytochromatia bacterium]